MTTTLLECKNLVNSFIDDMNKVHAEHRDIINAINKEREEIGILLEETSKNNSYSEELTNRHQTTMKRHTEIMKAFRRAQAEVLDKHSVERPKDFFMSTVWQEPPFFFCDQIIEERIVNKKKIKIFTEKIGYPNDMDQYKVFILDSKNDKWVISKIRGYKPDTKKDYPLCW